MKPLLLGPVDAITQDGEIIPITSDLGLRGRVLTVGWELPHDLTEGEWRGAGELLGKVERSVSWWVGDWWRAFKPIWGKQADVFEADEWDGPAYDTCRVAGATCAAFQIDRRRSDLSFNHHIEVRGMSIDEQDALLDWAAETIPETGKPRSTRELRREVHRRKNQLGVSPSSETCEVKDLHELAASGRRFGCFYVDPPWVYDNQGTRAATGNHYEGLTVDELCELPVAKLALPDAHLHLWITNAFLFEAPKIFAAWGFEFRSTFVWVKTSIGIGNYWRNSHEILLTAIRGDAKRFNVHNLRSWMECDRGKHSAKPEQVPFMLKAASPGPHIELFARLKREGWTVWGNNVERSNLFFPEERAAE